MIPTTPFNEYQRRRERLMAAIGPESVAIVTANHEQIRNSDVHHVFRQDSDFFYLTGFEEPDAILVLAPGHPDGDTAIFVRPRDLELEQWNGRRLGSDQAPQVLGLDAAFDLKKLDEVMPKYLERRSELHLTLGRDLAFERQLKLWLSKSTRARTRTPEAFTLLSQTLHELRVIKSDSELEIMRYAGDVSAAAHIRAMRFCEPGKTEHLVETELRYEFSRRGAKHVAYPPIVASGVNACIMHYIENSARLNDGEMLLIDAGCEIDHYASDITRTFPINGKFSSEQKTLYDIVLSAQLKAIDVSIVGAPVTAAHDASQKILTEGLIDIGLIDGPLEDAMADERARPYLVHRCSHWLGLDVHDVGSYRNVDDDRTLEDGMVMTIEPGIYVDKALDDESSFSGLGIRIEDDIHIRAEGPEILSAGAPKSIDDIEAVMNG